MVFAVYANRHQAHTQREHLMQRKEIRRTFPRALVAWTQILGGLYGIGLTFWFTFQTGNWDILVLGIPFIGIYAWAVAAGWWLWQRQPRGLLNSRRVQWLSLPMMSTPYFQYWLGIGAFAFVSAGISGGQLNFSFEAMFGSQWTLYFDSRPDGGPWLLGLNLVALACLSVLRD